MALTPQDVVRKEFREAFRGYNQADVDLFLDEIVDEMARLVEENQRLKVRVTALQQELARYRPQEGAPAETSEARWRLRRFLEEQGKPLDEIESVRSSTVERIAREVPPPPATEAPSGAPYTPPPRSREERSREERSREEAAGQPSPAPAPKPPPASGGAEQDERPWERESKPFWAAE
jgi:DivIVA domain-containing protein